MPLIKINPRTGLDRLNDDKYIINPPEFEKFAAWNHLLSQIHMSEHYIKIMLKFSADQKSLDDAYYHNAMFVAFLTSYGKCFAGAGKGKINLDAKAVFAGRDDLKKIHESIMGWRNTYVAHNSSDDIVSISIAVSDQGWKYSIKHFITIGIPFGGFSDFERPVIFVERYIIDKLKKHWHKQEGKFGKAIVLD